MLELNNLICRSIFLITFAFVQEGELKSADTDIANGSVPSGGAPELSTGLQPVVGLDKSRLLPTIEALTSLVVCVLVAFLFVSVIF